jgi:Protein of unknown function (DUF3828)
MGRNKKDQFMKYILSLFLLAMAFTNAAAAAPLSKQNAAAIRAQIVKIYKPYNQPTNDRPYWQHPIYTAQVRKLFSQWEKLRATNGDDEVDELSGGDWLCMCQDWDPEYFKLMKQVLKPLALGKVEVEVTLLQMEGQRETFRLIMVREDGKWLVDDILDGQATKGLKHQLREAAAKATPKEK